MGFKIAFRTGPVLSTSAKRCFRFDLLSSWYRLTVYEIYSIFLGALFEWECILVGSSLIFTASVFLILLLLEASRVHLLEDIWSLSVPAVSTGSSGLEAGFLCIRGQQASRVLLLEDIWPLYVTAMISGCSGLEAGFLYALEASLKPPEFFCLRTYDLCLSLLWEQVSLD